MDPKAIRTRNGWTSHVTIIDTFGNLTTDLRADLIINQAEVRFSFRDRTILGLVDSLVEKNGDLVALVDSEGFIEIGCRQRLRLPGN